MRYFVDQYYQSQEYRKASANQISAIERSGEPCQELTNDIHKQLERIENQIKSQLEVASNNSPVGRWANSIVGIGPVISAGLLAYIDIREAPTVGHIWRFAGLDPTQSWLGAAVGKTAAHDAIRDSGGLHEAVPALARLIGTKAETLLKFATTDAKGKEIKFTEGTLAKAAAKRPWNASLKTLCWHIGESFVKVSHNEKDIYGKLYLERKDYEQSRNALGELKDQAAAKLEKCKIGKDTEAYGYYSKGFLPPAHIHARAKRWTVKLFLAHWHEVAYMVEYQTAPPNPYAMERLGHAHIIHAPNWPMAA
jgi:hypothetical protein